MAHFIFVEKNNVPTLLKGLLSSFPSLTNGRIVSSLDDTIIQIANFTNPIQQKCQIVIFKVIFLLKI